jgi:5'-nucleotidase/UDP-sugar diphosphatase
MRTTIHTQGTSLTLLAATLALSACTSMVSNPPASKPQADTTYLITVLHTNDHHGRFWQNRDGEYGMAARKTIVDAVRKEVAASGGHTLLLDGGDVNTGVPESDLQNAVPDFKGMNLLGYDAMAVGNHEFDKSPSVLKMQRDLAKFPMLSANIYKGGERLFEPYRLFNLGDVRVAVMGLTTEDTRKMVHPDNVKDIEFRQPIAEAAALVPLLRTKADIVIAATHMGHYENGQHGTQAAGDVEMARTVRGIDLVVGGHTQNPGCMKAENQLDRAYLPGTACAPDRQNGTWIVQAHEWGKYVGRADFAYRNGELKLLQYALIPVNLKKAVGATPVSENPEMLALLKPYQDFGQEKLTLKVGSSDARLEGDRAIVRSQPTALGTLVGQAMMKAAKADFAIMNAGGIRDSLPAGDITYKDVLKVQPFGNTIVAVELSGQEVLNYLVSAAKMSAGSGAFPQFAGIKLTIDAGRVMDVAIQGRPLDFNKSYRLAINNFVAAGGDGYPKLTAHPSFVDTGFVDAQALTAYLGANSPLTAAKFAPGESVLRR